MDYTKYNRANDYEWLYENYVTLKKSTNELAKELGYKSANSIRQSLIRNEIPIRGRSESHRIKRVDNVIINHEVIEGTLLGDGYMNGKKHNTSDTCPSIRKKNKNIDHLKYVCDLLVSNGIVYSGTRYLKKTGKEYPQHLFFSTRSDKLIPYYNRWYPEYNGYKKVVPEDINITPNVLLHWFLDDGSTSYCGDKKNPMIIFCSESFTKDENQMLCDKINIPFSLGAKISPTNSGTGWRVRIPGNRCNDFFNILGMCPVKSLEYKWKLSRLN